MPASKRSYGDFAGGSVVETSPSNAGSADWIPGQGDNTPYALKPINK